MTSQATVSQLTARGRSAIAVIAIEGNDATDAIDQFFRPAFGSGLADREIHRVIYGDWQRTGDDQVAEGVVVRRCAGNRWEVHSHGGTAAVEAIIDDLVGIGCQQIEWYDEVIDHASDPIAAAAAIALSQATTARTAGHLLAQQRGALRLALTEIKQQLVDDKQALADESLQRLVDASHWGLHLTTLWKVVLCGSPNVGKSSLVNALLGYGRSIVYDRPGTTRDVLTATTAIDGWPVELSDTAGIRSSSDELEAAGIARAREALATADLVVPVIAGSMPPTDDDRALLAEFGERLVVLNKSDLPLAVDVESLHKASGQVVATSATTGEGIADLLTAIAVELMPDVPSIDSPTLFTDDQVEIVREAIDCIAQGDASSAIALIDRLTYTTLPAS